MKIIQPVSIWSNGTSKQAKVFGLSSIADDFKTSATLYYRLMEENQDGSLAGTLADGNLSIGGNDYNTWGSQASSDSNEWIYSWSAAKLNLTVIAEYQEPVPTII